jgi:hypothetical protein
MKTRRLLSLACGGLLAVGLLLTVTDTRSRADVTAGDLGGNTEVPFPNNAADPGAESATKEALMSAQYAWPGESNWAKLAPLPEVRYAVVPLRALGWPGGNGAPLDVTGGAAPAFELDDYNGVLGLRHWAPVYGQDSQAIYLRPGMSQPVDVPVMRLPYFFWSNVSGFTQWWTWPWQYFPGFWGGGNRVLNHDGLVSGWTLAMGTDANDASVIYGTTPSVWSLNGGLWPLSAPAGGTYALPGANDGWEWSSLDLATAAGVNAYGQAIVWQTGRYDESYFSSETSPNGSSSSEWTASTELWSSGWFLDASSQIAPVSSLGGSLDFWYWEIGESSTPADPVPPPEGWGPEGPPEPAPGTYSVSSDGGGPDGDAFVPQFLNDWGQVAGLHVTAEAEWTDWDEDGLWFWDAWYTWAPAVFGEQGMAALPVGEVDDAAVMGLTNGWYDAQGNELVPPVAYGWSWREGVGYEAWWASEEPDGTWTLAPITAYPAGADVTAENRQPADPAQLVGGTMRMNDRLELLVAGFAGSESYLVRNSRVHNLKDLIAPGWKLWMAQDINNSGVILAQATSPADLAASLAQNEDGWNPRQPVLLVPVELHSQDRMLVGSMPMDPGWTGLSINFRHKITGQDLGTYANVVEALQNPATASFHIYASRDDILSEAELDQYDYGQLAGAATTQPVVFYRDADNPLRLHFATIFNTLGEVEIIFARNGQPFTSLHATLTADTDFADLITHVDKRIDSIELPPVVLPAEIEEDIFGGGSSGGGQPGVTELLVAQRPGSRGHPGQRVSAADKANPANLVLSINDDNDDEGPSGHQDNADSVIGLNDDDLVKLTLRRPVGMVGGTITLTVSQPSSVRLFRSDGQGPLVNQSVNLSLATGNLASLALTGTAVVWVEGLVANPDLVLTLTCRNTQGQIIAQEAVHMDIAGSASAGYYDLFRVRDYAGVLAPGVQRLRLGSAGPDFLITTPRLQSIGDNECKQRNLATKALLNVVETSAKATVKIPVAYVKGLIDGAWDGVKSDASGLVEVAKIALHPIDRTAEIFHSLNVLYDMTNQERMLVVDHLVNSFMASSDQALPWILQAGALDDELALRAYIAGYTSGYVGEQIVIMWLGAGVISKAGQCLKVVLTACKTARTVLQGVTSVARATNVAFRTATQFVKRIEEVRGIKTVLEKLSKLQLGGQSLLQRVDEKFIQFGEHRARWNEMFAKINETGTALNRTFEQLGEATVRRTGQMMYFLGDEAGANAMKCFYQMYYPRLLVQTGDLFEPWLAQFDRTTVEGRTALNQFLEDSKPFLDDARSALPDGGGYFPQPDYKGFTKPPSQNTLPVGTIVDRYGENLGRYFSPPGTPRWGRSLKSDVSGTLKRYRVKQPLPVETGRTAPWFGQAGGGIGHRVIDDVSVGNLLSDYLEEIP